MRTLLLVVASGVFVQGQEPQFDAGTDDPSRGSGAEHVYHVIATIPEGTTKAQFHRMLRTRESRGGNQTFASPAFTTKNKEGPWRSSPNFWPATWPSP